MAEFKDRVRTLRKRNKLNQADLAAKLDMNKCTISRWETGERLPEHNTIERICDLFQVSESYLMGTTDVEDIRPNAGGIWPKVESTHFNLAELTAAEEKMHKLVEYMKDCRSLLQILVEDFSYTDEAVSKLREAFALPGRFLREVGFESYTELREALKKLNRQDILDMDDMDTELIKEALKDYQRPDKSEDVHSSN